MSRSHAARRYAEHVALVLVFAVVSGRLLAAWLLAFEPTGDYLAYFAMAQRLSAGELMKDHFGNLAYYNGGYPVLLAPFFALLDNDVQVAWAVNAALGGVSVYLVFRLGARLARDPCAGLLAALVWAVYVEGYVYGAYLAKENLSLTLFLIQALLLLRYEERRAPVYVATALGIVSGFQVLVSSATVALLPVIVFFIWRRVESRLRWHAAAAFIVATSLVVAPWIARNQILLGAPVFNTNGGFNLYLGNNPAATGYFVSIADTPLAEEWHVWRAHGEVHANRMAEQAARQHIALHPLETAALAVKKAVLFWWPPVHEGKRPVHWAENGLRAVWLLQYGLLIALAVWGAITLPRPVRRDVRPLWAMMAAYALLHALFYVIYRYRFPLMPIIVTVASCRVYFAAVGTLHRWETRRVPGTAA